MALPSWRSQSPLKYTGSLKWGTGVNPIHGQHSDSGPVGRNLAPGPYSGLAPDTGLIDDMFGYTPEDHLWDGGYGVDLSFMEAHPNLGDPDSHGQTGQFPDWGKNGIDYRSMKIGTNAREQMAQVLPNEDVAMGWTNKVHGDILDARSSDPSQYEIMTSWRQRELVKTNDSALARGTDDPRHSIATRLTGMKVRNYPGGQRHVDMTPVTQDSHPRPWLYRQTDDGIPPGWLGANNMVVNEPIQREVPADVYQGLSEVANYGADNVYTEGW
jgi:hypothetical protein